MFGVTKALDLLPKKMTLFRKQKQFDVNGFGERIGKRAFLMFIYFSLWKQEFVYKHCSHYIF